MKINIPPKTREEKESYRRAVDSLKNGGLYEENLIAIAKKVVPLDKIELMESSSVKVPTAYAMRLKRALEKQGFTRTRDRPNDPQQGTHKKQFTMRTRT